MNNVLKFKSRIIPCEEGLFLECYIIDASVKKGVHICNRNWCVYLILYKSLLYFRFKLLYYSSDLFIIGPFC